MDLLLMTLIHRDTWPSSFFSFTCTFLPVTRTLHLPSSNPLILPPISLFLLPTLLLYTHTHLSCHNVSTFISIFVLCLFIMWVLCTDQDYKRYCVSVGPSWLMKKATVNLPVFFITYPCTLNLTSFATYPRL